MAVLDVSGSLDAIAPVPTKELRPSIEAAGPRFSSAAAQALDTHLSADHTSRLAAELGTTERGLRTAEGMIRRHLVSAGGGYGTAITATFDGIRRAQTISPGLVVHGDDEASGFGIALISDPLVLLIVARPHQGLHWSLLSGGPSVTARADGLRLLRSLAAGGELTLRPAGRKALPPLVIDGGEWRDEDEWRLFEDLATVEEWSGSKLPMPDAVAATEATAAAQAASWARTQQVDARVDGAITFETTVDLDAESIDELRVHQDFDIRLLGEWVSMGEGIAQVSLDRVEPQGGGERRYRAYPARSDLRFALSPPSGRRLPAHRTQPEHVSPPAALPEAERRGGRAFARPARRLLADVLATARTERSLAPDDSLGTLSLLEDVRGE